MENERETDRLQGHMFLYGKEHSVETSIILFGGHIEARYALSPSRFGQVGGLKSGVSSHKLT